MMKSNRIIIIHPEGNINDNPNLTGIVELLVREGWPVTVYSPKRPQFAQLKPCEGADLVLVDRPEKEGRFLLPSISPMSPVEYVPQSMPEASLVIGVDRGIIEAALIARALEVPFGLISYEITFEDETSRSFKSPEISACRDIAFAIVQDGTRGSALARENGIPSERLFYVPVAGSGVHRSIGPRPKLFHERIGLPAEARIALYMGTVAKWSLCDALLGSVSDWPDHWHLVIHNRRGIDKETDAIIRAAPRQARSRIHVSSDPFERVSQMHAFIHSADLGVAFYHPTYQHYNLGKNLKYIGMSSGKIACCLQHGLPVAVNSTGEMSDWVRKRRIGQVVEDPSAFVPDDSVLDAGDRCIDFFLEHLDLRKTISPWLACIGRLLQRASAGRSSRGPEGAGSVSLPDHISLTGATNNLKDILHRRATGLNGRPSHPGLSIPGPLQNKKYDGFSVSELKEIAAIEWFHRIDLGHGVTTPGRDDSPKKLQQIGLPADLIGKSVLDIGAWDGFFSFAAERRGATRVVAADIATAPGFTLAKQLLKSKAAALEIDIMDLDAERTGTFDLVLCLGVLYHLKHPLMALERICSVAGRQLILETYVDMLDCPHPAMAFYPGGELNGDPSNWCGPNPAMVIAMLKTVGFKSAEMFSNTFAGRGYAENRAVFHAWK